MIAREAVVVPERAATPAAIATQPRHEARQNPAAQCQAVHAKHAALIAQQQQQQQQQAIVVRLSNEDLCRVLKRVLHLQDADLSLVRMRANNGARFAEVERRARQEIDVCYKKRQLASAVQQQGGSALSRMCALVYHSAMPLSVRLPSMSQFAAAGYSARMALERFAPNDEPWTWFCASVVFCAASFTRASGWFDIPYLVQRFGITLDNLVCYGCSVAHMAAQGVSLAELQLLKADATRLRECGMTADDFVALPLSMMQWVDNLGLTATQINAWLRPSHMHVLRTQRRWLPRTLHGRFGNIDARLLCERACEPQTLSCSNEDLVF